MTVWMIAERVEYADDADDYDTPLEEHGYFLSKDDAERKIAAINENRRAEYDQYVHQIADSIIRKRKEYADAVARTTTLRGNGFPNEPHPKYPGLETALSFDQWLDEICLKFRKYVPYPLDRGTL